LAPFARERPCAPGDAIVDHRFYLVKNHHPVLRIGQDPSQGDYVRGDKYFSYEWHWFTGDHLKRLMADEPDWGTPVIYLDLLPTRTTNATKIRKELACILENPQLPESERKRIPNHGIGQAANHVQRTVDVRAFTDKDVAGAYLTIVGGKQLQLNSAKPPSGALPGYPGMWLNVNEHERERSTSHMLIAWWVWNEQRMRLRTRGQAMKAAGWTIEALNTDAIFAVPPPALRGAPKAQLQTALEALGMRVATGNVAADLGSIKVATFDYDWAKKRCFSNNVHYDDRATWAPIQALLDRCEHTPWDVKTTVLPEVLADADLAATVGAHLDAWAGRSLLEGPGGSGKTYNTIC
jgi:hypothetical protein